MKYLRIYEDGNSNKEKADAFFRSRVDWKLYNYILYKATEYEDKYPNIIIRIVIVACNVVGRQEPIYVYEQGKLEVKSPAIYNYTEENLAHVLDSFKSGVTTIVGIGLMDGAATTNGNIIPLRFNRKLEDEFFDKIHDRCVKTKAQNYGMAFTRGLLYVRFNKKKIRK